MQSKLGRRVGSTADTFLTLPLIFSPQDLGCFQTAAAEFGRVKRSGWSGKNGGAQLPGLVNMSHPLRMRESFRRSNALLSIKVIKCTMTQQLPPGTYICTAYCRGCHRSRVAFALIEYIKSDLSKFVNLSLALPVAGIHYGC